MTAGRLEANVRMVGGLPVLDLRGEVDASAGATLDAAYEAASRDGPRGVLLNFADATYINSTGIALIVALLARARAAHQDVLVCGLNEHYRHIFQITRLADFMSIHEDEASAIAAASAS